jgi:hypothetical protein
MIYRQGEFFARKVKEIKSFPKYYSLYTFALILIFCNRISALHTKFINM